MYINRLKLKNWKNFKDIEVNLGNRIFIAGPNASGKSNFLDVFRFLREIAKETGGGLQKAVKDRGGLPKIRCLAARQNPDVEIDVEVNDDTTTWRYFLSIKQEKGGKNPVVVAKEQVWWNGKQIINRPDEHDKKDDKRLTQTYMEQINANVEFRGLAQFFEKTLYLHLIPQLIRHAQDFVGFERSDDPFGKNFLQRISKTPKKTRDARLRRIEQALKIAVPQFNALKYTTDEDDGKPHLEASYENWRGKDAKQREEQFSDGTLRLIALLWSLQEGEALLLLEEPELSLNSAIVEQLPELIFRIQAKLKRRRQVIMTTHSIDLLGTKSISGNEVFLLAPDKEGTVVIPAATKEDVRIMLESGFSVGEAIKPLIRPKNLNQLVFEFEA